MKYEPETIERICDAIRGLQGRVRAAKAGNISYETFTVWMRTKPEFSEAVKKAERESNQTGKELAILTIFRAMQNNVWQSAAWWLERNYPNEFRNVQEQKVEYNVEEARKKLLELISAKLN